MITKNIIEVYESKNINKMFADGTHPEEENYKIKIFNKFRCGCNAPFRRLGDYLALQNIRGYQFSI